MFSLRPVVLSVVRPLLAFAAARAPDVVIGPGDPPYLERWYVVPRNPIFNVCLHFFSRSDEDRALHDHPWLWNCSVVIKGRLIEHTIAAGGVQGAKLRVPGDVVFRIGGSPHRLEICTAFAWTLFITGPKFRTWGFHCPKGWRPWFEFCDPKNKGEIGRGCN